MLETRKPYSPKRYSACFQVPSRPNRKPELLEPSRAGTPCPKETELWQSWSECSCFSRKAGVDVFCYPFFKGQESFVIFHRLAQIPLAHPDVLAVPELFLKGTVQADQLAQHKLWGAEKEHKKISHKFSENPGPWMAGCPVSRQKWPFLSVFFRKQQEIFGTHRPADPCLSRRVSQGHPAGVPGIFLDFMCPFLS